MKKVCSFSGGRNCIVRNCGNTIRNNPSVIFHRLPKNKELCKKWLAAIGRDELLSKTDSQLHSSLVCGNHFKSCDYMNLFVSKRLLWSATPSLNNDPKVEGAHLVKSSSPDIAVSCHTVSSEEALRSRRLSPVISALPSTLTIKYSVLGEDGYGIYSKVFIPKGIRFGPYEGIQVHSSQKGKSSYCWQVMTESTRTEILNDQKKDKSNWLKYVNYARNEKQQNLIAVHFQKNIYYIVHKDISANSELLVWYYQYCYNGTVTKESCIRNEVGSTESLWHKIHQETPYKYMNENNSLPKYNFFNKELKEHQLIIEERLYTCNICHKKFTNIRNEYLRFTKICDACDTELTSSHQGSKVSQGEYIGDNCDVNTGLGIFGEASSFKLDNVSEMNVKKTKDGYNSCSNTYSFETVEKEKDACSHNVLCPSSLDPPLQIKMQLKLNECDIHNIKLSKSYNLHYNCDKLSIGKKEISGMEKNALVSIVEKLLKCGMYSSEMLSQSCSVLKPKKSCLGVRSDEGESYGTTIIEKYNAKQQIMQHKEKLYHSSLYDKDLVCNSKMPTCKTTHTVKKIYECDLCDKKFVRHPSLSRHKKEHYEKSHRCLMCGEKFSKYASLQEHKRIHSKKIVL